MQRPWFAQDELSNAHPCLVLTNSWAETRSGSFVSDELPPLSILFSLFLQRQSVAAGTLSSFAFAHANYAGVTKIFEVFLTLFFGSGISTGRALAGFRGGPDDGETCGRQTGATCSTQRAAGRSNETCAAR